VSESTTTAPRRMRRTIVITSCALLAAAVAATALLVGAPARSEAPTTVAAPRTVTVENKTLVHTVTARGTVGFVGGGTVVGNRSGIVTELPAVGTVLTPGSTAYRVNDQPVVVFRGALPAWRSFEKDMPDGADVRQLEQALRDAGLFRGTVDQKFTEVTEAAVKRWQKSLGVGQTGSIAFGDVVFLAQDGRVASTSVAVGDSVEAGKAVLKLSGTDQIINGTLASAAPSGVAVGARVSIVLPTGTTSPGTVRTVGAVAQPTADDASDSSDAGDQKSSKLPITVSFDDPAAARDLDDAAVRMVIETGTEPESLVVPVNAVLAAGRDGHGVQVPGKDGTLETRTVELGANADGDVIVTKGLREGERVVVPS
jgi:peptidoglycan hydrolase-like protein with peptidoglycan-binding domain